MALPLHCSLLQNPSIYPPPSSSPESHLLLLSDFVRSLRSSHVSFRRNISIPVFCSVSSDRNLGAGASSAEGTSGDGQSVAESEWSQAEPASPSPSPSEAGTAARARSSTETISLGIKEPVYEVGYL
ncbi:hypothetical protein ACLOJK_020909 [Asimina triloba]